MDFQTKLKRKCPSEHVNFQTKCILNFKAFFGEILTGTCEKLIFLFKCPETCKKCTISG